MAMSESQGQQRKLAAIMFTDMVGYSALAQKDEALALELLEEHRQLLRGVFPKFSGREVETTGDGFLVEFTSALEAARCAMEIQRLLFNRNLAAEPNRHIQLRIGMHVGDVVHKNGHILGDGVNVAARLHPLAEPGGICISVDVARQVQHNLEAAVILIGDKRLKNIRLPMEVYRIVLPWEARTANGTAESFSRLRRGRSKLLGSILGAGLLAGAIWLVVHQPRLASFGGSSNPEALNLYFQGKALVYLVNRTNLENGIELLERATKLDPNFADAYAELANAYTVLAYYFAPDQVHWRKCEGAVHTALALKPRSGLAHLANGRFLWKPSPMEYPHESAIRELQTAVALDPGLDEAYQYLAVIYAHIGLLEEAYLAGRKALEINPENYRAIVRAACALGYQLKFNEAFRLINSVPLETEERNILRNKAWWLFQLGRTNEAQEIVTQALKNNGGDAAGGFSSIQALLWAAAGRRDESISTIERILNQHERLGEFHHSAYYLATAYAVLNEPAKAVALLAETAGTGFPCYPLFLKDPKLANLRNYPAFQEFLSQQRKINEQYKSAFGSGNRPSSGR